MPTLKNEAQDFATIESKNLLFSTALATALGVALEAKSQADFEVSSQPNTPLAPRDQVKVDTELAQVQLTYLKAQKKTQQVQGKFEQKRTQHQEQTQTDAMTRQLLQVQLLTLPPLRKRLLRQIDGHIQQQDTQTKALRQTYAQQAQLAQQQEQQVKSYTAQLQESQNNIAPGTAQIQSAQAYYSQQRQIARQQLQQQQQALLDLKDQLQALTKTQQQQHQHQEQQLQALEIKQQILQAKLADLKLLADTDQKNLDQQQTAVQQALMQEENAFKALTAMRQKHSLLTKEQQDLFAELPKTQVPDELVSVTAYQDSQHHQLAEHSVETNTGLKFTEPKIIAGYALDLDRSLLLTDQEVVGSLRDLMDELAMTRPEPAVQCLNQALSVTPGRSNRGLLVYTYQRQITLVTKYQTTRHQVSHQLSATKVLQNKAQPKFEAPKAQTGYQIDWATSYLMLDDYDKNYLASYLVAAGGHGPEALTILNEDILANRLMATKLTLTYQYQPLAAEKSIPTPTGENDRKLQFFGPDRPLPDARPDVKSAQPTSKTQPKALFKSQAQLTQNTPPPPRQLFGGPVVRGTLLGTYGICKKRQGGHLVNRVMPRKY